MLLERAAARPRRPHGFRRVEDPAVAAQQGAWIAVSTNPTLIPFAGAPLDEDFRLPEEVLASLRPGPVYLRTFRAADGRPLDTLVWEKR